MIKLQPNPTFRFKVEISQAGTSEVAVFKLLGRHMGQTELRAWGERAKEMEGNDVAFLLEVITGWDEVVGEDGKPVKFDPQTFGALLDAYPGAALSVFTAYVRELSANRAKN